MYESRLLIGQSMSFDIYTILCSPLNTESKCLPLGNVMSASTMQSPHLLIKLIHLTIKGYAECSIIRPQHVDQGNFVLSKTNILKKNLSKSDLKKKLRFWVLAPFGPYVSETVTAASNLFAYY